MQPKISKAIQMDKQTIIKMKKYSLKFPIGYSIAKYISALRKFKKG